MTILRTGSNEKYSEGWDQVFGKRKTTKASKASSKRTVKKKANRKTGGKK
ncbi:MAG: hypothetical protein AAGF97_10055 [Planctomycetota bacterium]